MIRLIDIEIILARRREGSELNRVNIVYKSYGIAGVKPFSSPTYNTRINTSCAVVYTVSYGLTRSCTIANMIIHGHGTRASFLKV